MATVNLGAIKFNWKGAYNNSTAYAVDDVVSSSGSSYVCILASQGNAVSNGTYWNQMSAAGTNGTNGTNGTDVGTVITTQGDILYRDGSGLQRLAKGTANQVLKMNSGATAPEYGTLSSDFVKIASINQTTSATNLVKFDSCFTSAYDFYEIRGRMYMGSGNSYPRFQALNTSNAVLNGGSYKYTWGGSQTNSGGTDNTQNGGNISGDTSILLNTWNNENADKTKDFIINVTNPQTRVNLERPMIQWEGYGHSTGNEFQHVQGAGYYNTSDRWGGFQVYANSGNATWYVNVYGLKS